MSGSVITFRSAVLVAVFGLASPHACHAGGVIGSDNPQPCNTTTVSYVTCTGCTEEWTKCKGCIHRLGTIDKEYICITRSKACLGMGCTRIPQHGLDINCITQDCP